MACPICVSPEGSAITEGIRAGAGVLILVTAMIVGALVRFGYRLWAAEAASSVASTEAISAVTHD
jgi:hypothetical protein